MNVQSFQKQRSLKVEANNFYGFDAVFFEVRISKDRLKGLCKPCLFFFKFKTALMLSPELGFSVFAKNLYL